MASSDRLIILLNEENLPPKIFSNKNIKFDVPVEDDTLEEPLNSRVTVESIPGNGYYGDVEVLYRRIPMSELGDISVRSETGFTPDEIVTMINNLLGSSIGLNELEPIDVPTVELGETKTVVLAAKPESLGWISSVSIELIYGRPYLKAVIASRLLNVLTHVNTQNGLPFAKILSYDFDFSSYRDALKRDPRTLYPVDIPALQGVTAKLGFPNWNSGKLNDYATSQIADSNPAFDRVAVVALNSDGMVGPIYFHYNNFDGV